MHTGKNALWLHTPATAYPPQAAGLYALSLHHKLKRVTPHMVITCPTMTSPEVALIAVAARLRLIVRVVRWEVFPLLLAPALRLWPEGHPG